MSTEVVIVEWAAFANLAARRLIAKEALLDRVPVTAQQVHRMEGERADHDEAARAYEAILPDRLDLLVLGLGNDGHTASLFPGAPSLAETHRRVLAVRAPTAAGRLEARRR